MVILAWTGDELLRGQLVITAHTDAQAHRRRQRQYPKAKTGFGYKHCTLLYGAIYFCLEMYLLHARNGSCINSYHLITGGKRHQSL